ncbi:histidine kinase [Motiliproteus sp. MSK22-1]|uniref:histidine kinase n=1 Tax=Motiliproteus sp. MSK22-1 TaxID=1897630 RepID=UPI000976F3A4|nr:type IV pili methyl-accepting chemotaxis transducer N-terminal domain-containing protein [Motiliproteus sp. MSK22-1]OMH39124.1 hypothetical protein BGP75_05335 [Motiliproteus sp. MSK22-1]
MQNEELGSTKHHSIVFRAALILFGVGMLVFFSWLASVIVTESTDGDAATINISGSLRMQAYRIATVLAAPNVDLNKLEAETASFEARLNSPVLTQYIRIAGDHNELTPAYQNVTSLWNNKMRPLLDPASVQIDENRQAFLALVDDFVNDVDQVVLLIQNKAEDKITLLRAVGGISMFGVVIVMVIAMYGLRLTIVAPLNDLVLAAEKIRKGDMSARVTYKGDDELGLLGESFNLMTDELSRLYDDLEQRVVTKTRKLTQANNALALVYDITQRLSYEQHPESQFTKILAQLETATSLRDIQLCIEKPSIKNALLITTSEQSGISSSCDSLLRCDTCDTCEEKPDGSGSREFHYFPIRDNEKRYGTLQASTANGIEAWERRLMETVAESFATRLRLSTHTEQQRRIVLMEERTVIARELHDSLAQALSYLKIQVTLFKNLWRNDAPAEKTEAVLDELSNGLNSAYRQLRELLTTFRLTTDGSGLEPTLRSTVEEFNRKGVFTATLDYSLSQQALSPNEEVNVIQIVREALSNAFHHSQADQVTISLFDNNQDKILVQVRDNGIGIKDNPGKTAHYGLAIMQDRAESLKGRVTVSRIEPTGTCVELEFAPQAFAELKTLSG